MRGTFTLLGLFLALNLFSQGYNITVTIDGYTEPELYLAYNYGDKQYIQDTVFAQENGSFIFSDDESLEAGIYLVVLAPDNAIFQFMIDDDDQEFEITTTASDPSGKVAVSGHTLNSDFYAYLNFLTAQRPKANTINEGIKKAMEEGNAQAEEEGRKSLLQINKDVEDYQARILSNQPESLLSAVIKGGMQIALPDFSGSENLEFDRWMYTKEHWFDNLKMGDPRLLRTSLQFEKVNYYVEKLTAQHPDSISSSVDRILSLVEPAEETFKFYLIHFLNKYAASKVIGQDAVYVHIGEKYYKGGKANWSEEEQLKKIVDNVTTLKPLLLGKIAPDLGLMELDVQATLPLKDEKDEHKRFKQKRVFKLHEIDAQYTILFIWDPDCGHCKKQMPDMISFYEKWNPKGVELVALCTEVYKDIPKCAETITEKGMFKWINAIDPYIQSKYKSIYDVRTTPQLYVLDENKEIIMKKIDAAQLEEVFEELLQNGAE
ncbi:MAG: DUF5106 domain-containing protein [Saprospiraceae bacterium]|nr:DUF5106 domain-containing protein [Saprospiraceae bacterium]